MLYTMKKPCVLAIIFLSVLFCGRIKAQDGRSSVNKKYLPFIRTEADRWAFENQMKSAMKNCMKKIEVKAKKLLTDRYLRFAKVPEFNLTFSSKTPDGEIWRGTVRIDDNWCYDLSKINLVGDDVLVYENMSLIFTSNVNLWEQLLFIGDINVLKDPDVYKGNIQIQTNDVHYMLKVRLDFETKAVALVDFRQKCIGGVKLKIEGLNEEQEWLVGGISEAVSELYKGPAFEGIETVMRTILEESAEKVEIHEHLPKLDYEKNYGNEMISLKGLKQCPVGAANEETSTEDELILYLDFNLPFIQNEAELWAFQKQMKEKLNEYMEHLANRYAGHLVERELLRAKLPENSCLFHGRDESNTKRYGLLALSDGWLLNIRKFVSEGIHLLEYRGKEIRFSAYVHLSDYVEFIQEFKASIMNQEHEGRVKGRVDAIVYLLEFQVDLVNSTLTFENPTMDCTGKLTVEVSGLSPEVAWMTEGIAKSVLDIFKDSILIDTHKIISQTLEYAISETTIREYLPKWNYARTYFMELDERIGEQEDEKIEICGDEQVREAMEKQGEFSELITPEGIFKDISKVNEGRHYTHISGVHQQPVRYISTKAQSWYLEVQMRKKMNEYLYHLINKTRNIIQTQDLEKAKMPDYSQSLRPERDGNLILKNCWIDYLSAFDNSGIDVIEYDQKKLTLTTSIYVYWYLRFTSDYIANVDKIDYRGKVEGQLFSLIFSFEIDVDYLGSRTAKLQYLKLECIGGTKIKMTSDGTQDGSLTEDLSGAVDDVLKDKVVEEVVAIFHRSFEDAISNSDAGKFIPEFNYKRDFTTEIILNQKQNRFVIKIDFCNSTEPTIPSFETLYEDEKISPYEEILPQIRTEALRSSFQQQINGLMTKSLNSMWYSILNGSFQRYNPPKLHDNGRTFDLKDPKGVLHRLSIILRNSWNEGIMSTKYFREGELVYGNNDTLHILYAQPWDFFKVRYDLTVTDYTENTEMNGTIEATADKLIYLLKGRFGLHKMIFSVEEYYLYCLQGISVNVYGLSADSDWMLGTIKEQMIDVFQEGPMQSVKELLYILYGYAAEEIDASNYIPPWIYYKSLYDVAIQDEKKEDISNKCDTNKIGYAPAVIKGNVPFINSEAEWRSFSRQTTFKIHNYTFKLIEEAKIFLKNNFLDKAKLPDTTKAFVAEDPSGKEWEVDLTLTKGSTENLFEGNFTENGHFEFQEKELIITSYVTFTEKTTLSYMFEAKTNEDLVTARVQGIVESLIYVLKARVNFENKTTKIEDFQLQCIGGIEIIVEDLDSQLQWLGYGISEVTRKVFAGLLLNDINKVMHIAFGYGVIRVNVSEYIPEWNYGKDYSLTPKVDSVKRKEYFKFCPATATSNQTSETTFSTEITIKSLLEKINEEAIFFPDR